MSAGFCARARAPDEEGETLTNGVSFEFQLAIPLLIRKVRVRVKRV